MFDFEKVLDLLIKAGHKEAVEALRELKPENPLYATIWNALVTTAQQRGVEGLTIAKDRILKIIEGEEVELDFSGDLRVGFDLLSAMQRNEANDKSALRDFVTKVAAALEPVIIAIFSSLTKLV